MLHIWRIHETLSSKGHFDDTSGPLLKKVSGRTRKLCCLPGSTPLAIAAVMGHQGLVQLLLEKDAVPRQSPLKAF